MISEVIFFQIYLFFGMIIARGEDWHDSCKGKEVRILDIVGMILAGGDIHGFVVPIIFVYSTEIFLKFSNYEIKFSLPSQESHNHIAQPSIRPALMYGGTSRNQKHPTLSTSRML